MADASSTLPRLMSAVVRPFFAPSTASPGVMKNNVSVPTQVKGDEVLVRVKACGINPVDYKCVVHAVIAQVPAAKF